MKNLTDIKNEVAFEKENCKWNCLFMVDQWNYSDEVAKRYATEAIKADRERIKAVLNDEGAIDMDITAYYTPAVNLINNLPIELK